MTRLIPLHDVAGLVGQELGVSDWHTVSQDQIDDFAQATGDKEWFHIDVERATREMGGTIAHGFLTLSIVPVLWGTIARITEFKGGYNYGIDKARFTAPVRAGARIRLRATMREPQQRRGGTIVSVGCVIEVEGEDRPALVTDWSEIFYSEEEVQGRAMPVT
ncbi:MaoC family dehydratase [Novosphingobium lentum]|uniref:MaoC family dehydratase n=1 Tax=Novosphingobium lentum TaxID=145287 RepID=UPI00082D9504|nr:MaoC family dehydratase [Novosphingobium lentum]